MPVQVAKIGGKYRVVDRDGKVTTNKKGGPVDAGGHNSRRSALNQVRAINISMHKNKSKKDFDHPAYHERPMGGLRG